MFCCCCFYFFSPVVVSGMFLEKSFCRKKFILFERWLPDWLFLFVFYHKWVINNRFYPYDPIYQTYSKAEASFAQIFCLNKSFPFYWHILNKTNENGLWNCCFPKNYLSSKILSSPLKSKKDCLESLYPPRSATIISDHWTV